MVGHLYVYWFFSLPKRNTICNIVCNSRLGGGFVSTKSLASLYKRLDGLSGR